MLDSAPVASGLRWGAWVIWGVSERFWGLGGGVGGEDQKEEACGNRARPDAVMILGGLLEGQLQRSGLQGPRPSRWLKEGTGSQEQPGKDGEQREMGGGGEEVGVTGPGEEEALGPGCACRGAGGACRRQKQQGDPGSFLVGHAQPRTTGDAGCRRTPVYVVAPASCRDC